MQTSARLSDQLRYAYSILTQFIDRTLTFQTHPNTIRLSRAAISLWVIFSTLLLAPAGSHFWAYDSYIPLADIAQMNLWNKALNLLSLESVSAYYPAFVIAQLVAAVFAGLSLSPRLSSAALYFLTTNLDNRASVTMDGGNNLMHILLFLLIFIAPPTAKKLDTKGFRTDLAHLANAVSNASFFLVRVQVALVYATAGLLKVKGGLWPKGVALYYTMNVVEYGNQMVAQVMTDFPLLLVFSCYMTVLFQVSFPILIWPRLTRPFMMLIGTVFHVSIIFVMGLTTFGLAMCTSYVFFYPDEKAARLLSVFTSKTKVYAAFDEECGICQAFARVVAWLDWRSLVVKGSAQNPDDQQIAAIPMRERLTEIYAADERGMAKGFDAIVMIAVKLPLLIPMIPLMKFVGYIGIGDQIYKRIAQNSGWRKQCQTGVCQLS